MDGTVFHDDDGGDSGIVEQLYTTPSERLVVVDSSRPSTAYYEKRYCEECYHPFGGHRSAGYYDVQVRLLFVRDVFTGQVFRLDTKDLTPFDRGDW